VALNENECQQCRAVLGQLKAEYGGAGQVPEVKARIGEVEAALERECSSSGSSSSEVGAALVGLGVLAVGAVGFTALLAAAFRSRQ